MTARLSRTARRALALLASDQGITEELFIHRLGFRRQLLAGLVRRSLVEIYRERVFEGDQPIEVEKLRLTLAGRLALAKIARDT
jgi:hypothetical protein